MTGGGSAKRPTPGRGRGVPPTFPRDLQLRARHKGVIDPPPRRAITPLNPSKVSLFLSYQLLRTRSIMPSYLNKTAIVTGTPNFEYVAPPPSPATFPPGSSAGSAALG